MESSTEDPTNSSARNIGGGGGGGGGEGEGEGDEAAAVDLLEEAWFFGNLLYSSRKHMTRSLSDPGPSSFDYNHSGNPSEPKMKLNKESSQEIPLHVPAEKNLDRRKSSLKKLIQDRPPPPPPPPPPPSSSCGDQDNQFHTPSSSEKTIQEVWKEAVRGKASGGAESEPMKRSPRPVLLRAPSLPPCIGREKVEDEEILQTRSHPRMNKSNRQSSLNISDLLPPQHPSKEMMNYRSPISSEADMRRRLLNRTKSIKSRGELEFEELQGFKDLGFTFDKKDLSPSIVNILPGLQEKKDPPAKAEEDQKQRRPYLSEAWLTQSFAPPIPKWSPRGSAEEDVKAHIKFWARAVASNVR